MEGINSAREMALIGLKKMCLKTGGKAVYSRVPTWWQTIYNIEEDGGARS